MPYIFGHEASEKHDMIFAAERPAAKQRKGQNREKLQLPKAGRCHRKQSTKVLFPRDAWSRGRQNSILTGAAI